MNIFYINSYVRKKFVGLLPIAADKILFEDLLGLKWWESLPKIHAGKSMYKRY